MEKQFAVKISVWMDEYSDECHRHNEGRGAIETFLHEVAADGRRFRLVSAGRLQAVVAGICTGAEIEGLRDEIDDFFTVYGLDCGENGWSIHPGKEIPTQRMVFEDGIPTSPVVSLTLILDEDWAAEQAPAPALTFLTRLQDKLGCRFGDGAFPHSTGLAHLRWQSHTDRSVTRIWNAGQDALKELDALAHVMKFEVREIQENEEEQE